MTWEEEDLAFGYIVSRLPDGGWWHLHFGRANMEYPCELLGRKTNLTASIQMFAKYAVRQLGPFILTLDGEGIDSAATKIDFKWDIDSAMAREALYFQREIIPLIYDSDGFQSAVLEIVKNQRHLRIIAASKLIPLD